MARTTRGSGEQDGVRILDPRHHFLGLLKGEEVFVYCRRCQQFVLVVHQLDDTQGIAEGTAKHIVQPALTQ